MYFRELEVNALFTFHSFSEEVYRKVSDTQCLCISYPDEVVDAPYSLNQRVYPVTVCKKEVKTVESCDRFTALSLITKLRGYMKEVSNNDTLEEKNKEGIRLGLAWAVVEIMEQAQSKDRFSK